MPRKVVHGGPSLNYTSWAAVAIEQEGYLDAINTPEFGVDQICEHPYFHDRDNALLRDLPILDGPGRDFDWSTTYKFSTVK